MIDAVELTKVLKRLVVALEDDLRARADVDVEVAATVSEEFERAVSAGRTALSELAWRDQLLTQVAVGWVLATVFVRFCEDNGLIADPLVSGPGERGRQAEGAQTVFLRGGAELGERDYLLHVFTQARALPGLDQVLGAHNPLWLFGPSEDGTRQVLNEFRVTGDASGVLVWDFTDAEWGTRFLGDLYQDLSEAAKKNFALLQTPDFVESFILDRTLDPAIDEFGLDGFAMIDPACGSGHFLLGSFDRLFARWQAKAPQDGARANAAKALRSVNGVDINPFAAAIAKFRLLVAALKVSGIGRLLDAPAFELRVATGDSLLHAPVELSGQGELGSVRADVDARGPAAHLFSTEDGLLVREILGREYEAVVANPPYITPKDAAANAAYRDRFETCHRQYALSVPFMELIFRLARRGTTGRTAGFTGQITANSFMKRQFGTKLIEQHLAKWVELTHVVDSSNAHIPGHTTPTVVLFGRNRLPSRPTVRAVFGLRGEAPPPSNARAGLVWLGIEQAIDQSDFENEFVSSADLAVERIAKHPWSLTGGSAIALKTQIEARCSTTLSDFVIDAGATFLTRADDAYELPMNRAVEARYSSFATYFTGKRVRDWQIRPSGVIGFPYAGNLESMPEDGRSNVYWPYRSILSRRVAYGKTQIERGLMWYEYSMLFRRRVEAPVSVHWSDVITHNHFSINRGRSLGNSHAPKFYLDADSDESEYHNLVGLLNSSVALFWMKQVCHNKGAEGHKSGIKSETWERFFEFDWAKIKKFPIAAGSCVNSSELLHDLARELIELEPTVDLIELDASGHMGQAAAAEGLRRNMHSVQEELDWRCYHLYGVTEDDLSLSADEAPSLALGERAFEIVLARKMAAGTVESSWFERHGSTPITELPSHWSPEYRALVERRIALIEADRNVRLCEQPEHKRRWNWPDWDALERVALESWMLTRLEDASLWTGLSPLSVAQLADRVRADAEFVSAVEMYAGVDADLVKVIGGLVADDAVPYLAAWRYKPAGLRKRAEWEATWALQRREDVGEEVGEIPVPPKYTTKDFLKTSYWKLRGKLDVPKERFVLYPGAERANDGTLLVGWAGWDHLEQGQALATLIGARQASDGWGATELQPLLAGLAELVPWLQQWHNDVDPETGERLGDFYDTFLTSRCAQLGLDRSQLADWRPPTTSRRRKATT